MPLTPVHWHTPVIFLILNRGHIANSRQAQLEKGVPAGVFHAACLPDDRLVIVALICIVKFVDEVP